MKEDLIEPSWLPKKTIVLNEIDKYMAKNNYYQLLNMTKNSNYD